MSTTVRITPDDQAWFARVSGDHSPVHVDPARAARMVAGEPVVHGVHAVLAALEAVAEAAAAAGAAGAASAAGAPEGVGPRPARLEVRFVKPVLVGETVDVARDADGSVILAVDGSAVVVVRVHDRPRGLPVPEAEAGLLAVPVDPTVAAELGPRDLVVERGAIVAPPDAAALTARFPHVAAWFGDGVAPALAAASRLVGMHRPGTHALLTGLDVDLDPAAGACAPDRLGYAITRLAAGGGRVELAVHGLGISGRVVALVASVAAPPSDAELDGWIEAGAFAGDRPLIVGGGRGLGATLARLVARGGARPVVASRSDAAAAARTVAAIEAAGGRADALLLDVMDPDAAVAALDRLGWDGQQLHYFATPRIFRRHLGGERAGLEDEFAAVYVDAFARLVRALVARAPGRPLAIGYPSSVAVDDPPDELAEYARAKARGEAIAHQLAAELPEVTVHVRRFPRLETEQTATFLPVTTVPLASELAPFACAVHARRGDAAAEGGEHSAPSD